MIYIILMLFGIVSIGCIFLMLTSLAASGVITLLGITLTPIQYMVAFAGFAVMVAIAPYLIMQSFGLLLEVVKNMIKTVIMAVICFIIFLPPYLMGYWNFHSVMQAEGFAMIAVFSILMIQSILDHLKIR